jgi:hypothetical protein
MTEVFKVLGMELVIAAAAGVIFALIAKQILVRDPPDFLAVLARMVGRRTDATAFNMVWVKTVTKGVNVSALTEDYFELLGPGQILGDGFQASHAGRAAGALFYELGVSVGFAPNQPLNLPLAEVASAKGQSKAFEIRHTVPA